MSGLPLSIPGKGAKVLGPETRLVFFKTESYISHYSDQRVLGCTLTVGVITSLLCIVVFVVISSVSCNSKLGWLGGAQFFDPFTFRPAWLPSSEQPSADSFRCFLIAMVWELL